MQLEFKAKAEEDAANHTTTTTTTTTNATALLLGKPSGHNAACIEATRDHVASLIVLALTVSNTRSESSFSE